MWRKWRHNKAAAIINQWRRKSRNIGAALAKIEKWQHERRRQRKKKIMVCA